MSSDQGAASGPPSGLPVIAPSAGVDMSADFDRWEAVAVEELGTVQDPGAAESLLARITLAESAVRIAKMGAEREKRWKVVRLKAERRYGELLPPPDRGRRDGSVTSGNTRKAQHQARKVAAVPQQTFDEYVDNDPSPTRDGLLRKHRPPPVKRARKRAGNEPTVSGKTSISHDPAVLEWVGGLIRQGWEREQIVQASKDVTHGWPRRGYPHRGEYLSNGTESQCRAAIAASERATSERATSATRPTKKRSPTESGKRLRKLHAEKRDGRPPDSLWEMQVEIATAVGRLERFELPDDPDLSEETDHLLNEVQWDISRLVLWSRLAFEAVVAARGDIGEQRTLKILRERAADPRENENERANAAFLLDRLEKKRKRVLNMGDGTEG